MVELVPTTETLYNKANCWKINCCHNLVDMFDASLSKIIFDKFDDQHINVPFIPKFEYTHESMFADRKCLSFCSTWPLISLVEVNVFNLICQLQCFCFAFGFCLVIDWSFLWLMDHWLWNKLDRLCHVARQHTCNWVLQCSLE